MFRQPILLLSSLMLGGSAAVASPVTRDIGHRVGAEATALVAPLMLPESVRRAPARPQSKAPAIGRAGPNDANAQSQRDARPGHARGRAKGTPPGRAAEHAEARARAEGHHKARGKGHHKGRGKGHERHACGDAVAEH